MMPSRLLQPESREFLWPGPLDPTGPFQQPAHKHPHTALQAAAQDPGNGTPGWTTVLYVHAHISITHLQLKLSRI